MSQSVSVIDSSMHIMMRLLRAVDGHACSIGVLVLLHACLVGGKAPALLMISP